MSSALERFRDRQPRANILDVPWPLDSKTTIFKVARFSTAELTSASWMAEKILREKGLTRASDEWKDEFEGCYMYALSELVKRHVKTWEHKPADGGEPVPFSPGALETVFKDMNLTERVELGISFLLVMADEDKKKDDQKSPDSSSS